MTRSFNLSLCCDYPLESSSFIEVGFIASRKESSPTVNGNDPGKLSAFQPAMFTLD